VINSLVFVFQIPIVCLTDDVYSIQPLIIKTIKPDYHLKINKTEYLHKNIMKQQNTKNIIHHINGNEFDNRKQNLLEISITEEE
jgi:hypothetical protein